VDADEAIVAAQEIRRHAVAECAFAGDAARDLLTGADATAPDIAKRLRIAHEHRALDRHDELRHGQAHVAIENALTRLRASPGSHALSHDAPAALRDACGFTRVMISRARGSRWYPDTMRVGDGADPEAEEFERFATEGNEIPLGGMLPETQMVRQGIGVLVADPASDLRAYRPLVRVTRTPGYVAAPIMTGRRAIGFLHADRAGQRSPVTAGDLECISHFATEFGLLFERAVLAERIERLRAEAGAALRRAAADLDAGAGARIALEMLAPQADGAVATPAPRRDALLTAREREVVELLATGATNQAIARELVVSTDTVKTHVSNLLRKLDASSRADAVSSYLRLQARLRP
jgi:DNA-binding CsgD family transcriptional regulator